MFSLDLMIAAALPVALEFVMANKFSLLAIFYSLDKAAKLTKTTIDDSIITLLKNVFFRIIGKGKVIDEKYEFFKSKGLVHVDLSPELIKNIEKDFLEKNKFKDNPYEIPTRTEAWAKQEMMYETTRSNREEVIRPFKEEVQNDNSSIK